MRIEVRDYTKRIGSATVLDNINAIFERNKVYGLVGVNGSGKTMLLRALAGLIRPNEGKVIVDGQELNKDISFPNSMGIIIETPDLLGHLTGLENLKMLADIQRKVSTERICELMETFGLDPKDKRVLRKYSLGMKQKIGIIQAIMEDPELLILDEPFNALDRETVEKVWGILLEFKKKGKTIILTSHHKEDIDNLCDEVLFMEEGRLVLP